MADIFVPGVKSRFDTEKMIESLMEVERLPKKRVEERIGQLEAQKGYWQDLGRQLSSLRESARNLYSFQNPFNERVAVSDNGAVLSAQANRDASEMEHYFVVKQVAQADRFVSLPLDSSYKAPSGNYLFTAGDSKVSLNFRGGTIQEFADALNQRGKDKIHARVVNTGKNEKALMIEAMTTGENSRLGFKDDALKFALDIGLLVKDDASDAAPAKLETTPKPEPQPPAPAAAASTEPQQPINIQPVSSRGAASANGLITEQSQGAASTASPMSVLDIPILDGIKATPSMMLKFESEITSPLTGRHMINSLMLNEKETAERNMQNLSVLSLVFDDGSSVALPPVSGEAGFRSQQVILSSFAGDKTVSFLRIDNNNTAREVSVRNIQIFNSANEPQNIPPKSAPSGTASAVQNSVLEAAAALDENWGTTTASVSPNPGYKPRSPVSTAKNAVLEMDGIEIKRTDNVIDDLLPGVTLTAKAPSESPVRLGIERDSESVKESLISLVGNYNRLIAEINVLTRSDPAIINELTYLSAEEKEDLRKKSGAFQGDANLSQLRSNLVNVFTTPYQLKDGKMILASELGISSDAQRRGGYDPSKMRGYMEIDEKSLDAAIASRLSDIQAMFGLDTDGDMVIDSGLAFSLERTARPYVETGGTVSQKTATLDSRIAQDKTRIESLDRQLAAKEQTLKNQYGAMEGAYTKMERMSDSLDNFSKQNSNGR